MRVEPWCRSALLLSLGLLLEGCQRELPKVGSLAPVAPGQVRTVVLQAQVEPMTDDVVGTVRARVRASMEAKMSGRIEALTVAPGQSVRVGDPLVRLDVREIRARLEQTLAQREQAERDLKRFTTLLDQNAITRQEFDAAESRARSTRAAVTEAETLLSYSQVTAPFSGVITKKFAEVGDLASPGKPLLELEDPESLRFEADIPEALIGRITPRMAVPIRVPALGLELTGTVSEIAPAGDPNTRTFLVKMDVPSTVGLRVGLFGRVAVPAGERTVIRIPTAALVVRGQLEMVFVVENGFARLRLVRSGKHRADSVELLSGVNAGDAVVLQGVQGLVDGQAVEVRP